ncbi:hypothetical protein HBN54_002204 [Hymenobacter sp. 1B]|uniref:Uncharacterized protein n=1 Tax=Hymenobacter artigasi TaxID=2719616 RepID=A0ABX1HKT9_9BACT|nr:hypothetical protein [Hymenobacter artigasi]
MRRRCGGRLGSRSPFALAVSGLPVKELEPI